MNSVLKVVKIRQEIFKSNIERARALSKESMRIAEKSDKDDLEESLGNDIGMYSIVAAVGSLDEFIKSSTFHILLHYITMEWKPEHNPVIDSMVRSEPSKFLKITLKIISDLNSRHDFNDIKNLNPSYLNELSKDILEAVEKLNYQSYKNIRLIIEGLSGKKFTKDKFPDLDKCITVINTLSDKRHEYVHRMATDPVDHASTNLTNYDHPVRDEDLDRLIKFSDYVVSLFEVSNNISNGSAKNHLFIQRLNVAP